MACTRYLQFLLFGSSSFTAMREAIAASLRLCRDASPLHSSLHMAIQPLSCIAAHTPLRTVT